MCGISRIMMRETSNEFETLSTTAKINLVDEICNIHILAL